MKQIQILTGDEISAVLDYPSLVEHLRLCHLEAPPASRDVLLTEPGESKAGRSFLSRAAWRRGKALGIKSASVFPENHARGLPTVQGVMLLFDGETGALMSILDGEAITHWKTAAVSALGAKLMAREEVRTMLMVGAGAMSEHLIRAHLAIRSSLRDVLVWNRTPDRVDRLVNRLRPELERIRRVDDLEAGVREADLVCAATAAEEPLIRGAWLRSGVHLDLVGSFTPQMREADVSCFARAEAAVDWRQGTVGQCGEVIDAFAASALSERNFHGDLFEICAAAEIRRSRDSVTVFKNGGGGHLDLMTAEFVALRSGL